MGFRNGSVVLASLPLLCTLGHADFKYTEKSQVTGGGLVSMTKMVSVFNKNAKTAMEPTTRTVAVKGGKMRTEESDGKIQIIDLEGRRFINIDPGSRSYTIMTFDEMKKAMEQKQAEMQGKIKEEQAQQDAQGQPPPNMKITPKFESTETGATQTILGLPTKELKATVEMMMESSDPKTRGQQLSTIIHTDQWIAPDVPHYDEIRDFYLKMAKEMDWVPGQVAGAMANSNIQFSMSELRKSNLAHIKGMPLVTYTSMTMAANGQDPNAAAQQPAVAQQQQQQPAQDNSIPTNPSAAVMKGLGGMFGHKKDKQQADANSGSSTANPASTPGSMMDTKTEVTSFSSDSLDDSLFGPPAGYAQKQVTAEDLSKSRI